MLQHFKYLVFGKLLSVSLVESEGLWPEALKSYGQPLTQINLCCIELLFTVPSSCCPSGVASLHYLYGLFLPCLHPWTSYEPAHPIPLHVIIFIALDEEYVGRVAQSVYWLTTGWTVRNRIPVGTRFSPVQTGPGTNPASCTMGTESFLGVKSGRGVLLTTHSL